jgi:hypothetical protein
MNVMARDLDFQSDDDLPVGRLIKWLLDPEAQGSIARAGLILGVNVRDPEQKSLFFGRATLKRIKRSGKEREMHVLEVPVDFETNDLEALVAACVAIKGSCCYRAYGAHGDEPHRINPSFN